MMQDSSTRVIDDTEERIDDFDGIVEDFSDHGGGGNPRCWWDRSVCLETVTHHITFAYPAADGEQFAETETFCPRHYAVRLAEFVHFHPEDCPVTLSQHLVRFGDMND